MLENFRANVLKYLSILHTRIENKPRELTSFNYLGCSEMRLDYSHP